VFLVENLIYSSKRNVWAFPFVPRILKITGVYVPRYEIYQPTERFLSQNIGSERHKI